MERIQNLLTAEQWLWALMIESSLIILGCIFISYRRWKQNKKTEDQKPQTEQSIGYIERKLDAEPIVMVNRFNKYDYERTNSDDINKIKLGMDREILKMAANYIHYTSLEATDSDMIEIRGELIVYKPTFNQ